MRVINYKNTILAMLVFALLVGGVFAQQGKMGMKEKQFKRQGAEHFPKIPDLTDEQQEQIIDLKTEHLKSTLPLKNQLREKQAHLQTVSTGDNVDMNKVNKTIEEISTIKVKMAKKRAAHRQQIRNLLTDEQRVFFDSRPRGRGNGDRQCRPGMGQGERVHRKGRF